MSDYKKIEDVMNLATAIDKFAGETIQTILVSNYKFQDLKARSKDLPNFEPVSDDLFIIKTLGYTLRIQLQIPYGN